MILSNPGKMLLAVSALVGFAVLASPSPGKAAPADHCAVYAQDVAADYAPRYRGLVGGLIAMPFDVTSALLTGRTSGDFEWKRAYDTAYADCMSGRMTVASAEPLPPRAGTRAWLDYCSAKYRSFNPDTGTYMTYSGAEVPCR